MTDLLLTLFGDGAQGAPVDFAKPLAYCLAALVCVLLATSQSLALRTPMRLRRVWLMLCPLYLLAGANSLVQGDVLWVQWARNFARQQQFYEGRRAFQLLALLLLAVLATALWRVYQNRQPVRQASVSMLHRMLLIGASGTLGLLLLRFVSFHYIDLVLNAYWLHHSVSSWVEVTSLGLAGLATGLALLRSYGHV